MAASITNSFIRFFEKSFDDIHTKKPVMFVRFRVFRVWPPQKVALSMYPMGPTLKEEFLKVEDLPD
jgi:putative ABC transport system permease protein